ncbi:murein biosynthesis integral membrane protein MurJ [Streptomyces sp. NRRL S-118]|uniref:murein biosynthesis integral membrane protein MurJ n=1 Tax=Streptomyces sp. NRRL S-118 TaxID=1463881 RepID=UPI00099C7C9E|nr:murein biosynthesis integral membrane protein MurJ [Streptomyces sp. NRRL S-118]
MSQTGTAPDGGSGTEASTAPDGGSGTGSRAGAVPGDARKAVSAARSSAVMAAGSLVSRGTGFVRSAVVAAALGTIGPTADGYAVGNSLPTIVYMLLLGGALNAVFVPELVKAAKEHDDGGAAYTDRLVTVCVVALLAITATAVWAAPAIVDAYTDYSGPQAAMTTAFARYCLPQIFFLGLFTLLGQVLNARGRFGAMMWAPVLNNVVVISVFGLFLALAMGGGDTLTATETALLGWGTTAGIAVQALALVPGLRAARFRWRPRFDWRGSGLTRPLRSAGWLVLLVLANQAAYWVTTRLATTAGLQGGPGYSAYNNAYALWVVPHGIITVSLVTALLPRMSAAAADADTAALRRDVSHALRASAAAVVPAACMLFALAHPVMALVFGHGRTSAGDTAAMAGILMAFAPGLVAMSGQYVLSRTFYALGDTRTPFLLNLVIVTLNAGLSVSAAQLLPARWAVTGMAAAYSLALFAGWAVTGRVLSRRLVVARPWRSSAVVAHARLLLAAVPAAALGHLAATGAARAGVPAATAAGAAVIVLTFALLARPLRLTELDALITGVRRRLARR